MVKKIFNIINEEINKWLFENKNISILYHGSKYYFDKFDVNKVNTGQHSQDFGYGLYFTSNKDTAKFYANELSNMKTPIQKYHDIVKNNKKNDILIDYLNANRLTSAKRILNDLIKNNVGDISEWKELLNSLDKVERYGYIYTVRIKNANYINKNEYNELKKQLNLSDKEMNNVLLEKGYNGIIYNIDSFNLKSNSGQEYNVVIIDDQVISILDVEQVNFEGVLKLHII